MMMGTTPTHTSCAWSAWVSYRCRRLLGTHLCGATSRPRSSAASTGAPVALWPETLKDASMVFEMASHLHCFRGIVRRPDRRWLRSLVSVCTWWFQLHPPATCHPLMPRCLRGWSPGHDRGIDRASGPEWPSHCGFVLVGADLLGAHHL